MEDRVRKNIIIFLTLLFVAMEGRDQSRSDGYMSDFRTPSHAEAVILRAMRNGAERIGIHVEGDHVLTVDRSTGPKNLFGILDDLKVRRGAEHCVKVVVG